MIQVLIVDDDSLLCRAMANKLEYVNQEGGLDLAPAITAGTAPGATAMCAATTVSSSTAATSSR